MLWKKSKLFSMFRLQLASCEDRSENKERNGDHAERRNRGLLSHQLVTSIRCIAFKSSCGDVVADDVLCLTVLSGLSLELWLGTPGNQV